MELKEILFGGLNYQAYLGGIIIVIFGYALWFGFNYVMSSHPSKWDWKIFHADKNIPYLILLVGCSIAFLRFQSDSLEGINKLTGSKLGFIKDAWFWFLIGGALFRFIIHRAHKLYKKYNSKPLN